MSFIVGSIIIGGGALAGGLIGSSAAKSAASDQANAALAAANISKDEFNTVTAQEQPFLQSGYGALSALDYGLGINPQSASGGPASGVSYQVQKGPGTSTPAPAPTVTPTPGHVPAPVDPNHLPNPVRANHGGLINGRGTGTSDSIPARLSNGEYVINARAAAQHLPLLQAINSGGQGGNGHYAEGGIVRPGDPTIAPQVANNPAPTMLPNTAPNGTGVGANGVPYGVTTAGSPGGTGLGYGSLTKQFDTNDWASLSPQYNFTAQQGKQGVLNGDASGAGALSGAAAKDLINFNQANATNSFNSAFNNYQAQQNNIFNRLYDVSSLGQNAAANLGSTGANLAGQQAQSLTNIGTAQAGGAVGAANAWSGALSSATPWLANSIKTAPSQSAIAASEGAW